MLSYKFNELTFQREKNRKNLDKTFEIAVFFQTCSDVFAHWLPYYRRYRHHIL